MFPATYVDFPTILFKAQREPAVVEFPVGENIVDCLTNLFKFSSFMKVVFDESMLSGQHIKLSESISLQRESLCCFKIDGWVSVNVAS